MAQTGISLYLEREGRATAAKSNLDSGFYAVTVTRAYYAMF
jgi:uncharacterized protein (UPF0332 family)